MQPKKILFYRDYQGFTGGHLKVWDYFSHTQFSDIYEPDIYFSDDSDRSIKNPWFHSMEDALSEWRPDDADALFVGGVDWKMLSQSKYDNSSKPIINLIQHVRHADPKDIRYSFLKKRAIRICVGEPVTEAIRDTGQVNGPVFTIPNGIDFGVLPAVNENRSISILIAALKQPELGKEIAEKLVLMGHEVTLLTKKLPRTEYLDLLASTKIGLFLPHQTEGFYLPALEAMALGVLVICPDCIGNREFCRPDYNCISSEYNISALVNAVGNASSLTGAEYSQCIGNAYNTVQNHDIEVERKAYLEILNQLQHIW